MSERKNILFIFPDQMRADYLGCYGASFAKTPNIDKLAAEGIRYENAISPSPACIPARASIFTGRNSIENGVMSNNRWLRPDKKECGVQTWTEQLAASGYETVGIGKMHFYPWDSMEGFEKRIISEDKRHVKVQDDYAQALETQGLCKKRGWEHAQYTESKGTYINELPRNMQADQWITEQACEYLKNRQDERPFALMVGWLSPHCPYDPDASLLADFPLENMPEPIPGTASSNQFHDSFVQAYRAAWSQLDYSTFTETEKRNIKAYYSACIADIDICVGKLLNTLKEQHLEENTVVVFASDHGDFAGDFEMVGKGQFYEPSVHVPLIVRGPSADFSGQSDAGIVSLTDVNATILQIAGITPQQTVDCKVLSCYQESTENRIVHGANDNGWFIRDGAWKYCTYGNGLKELYNLVQDPHEQNNLIDEPEHKQVLDALSSDLNIWVMNSIERANREKIANVAASNPPERFYTKDWVRPYPFCAKEK